MKHLLIIFGITIGSFGCLFSQERISPNIFKLQEGQPSPPAKIEQLSWLVGDWVGEGLGGQCAENWSAPSLGHMIGTFRMEKAGEIVFFEFMDISEKEGSLIFRLKHFTSELIGWEEKEKFVEFRLVKIEENAAYFGGLTLRKKDDNHIEIFVSIKYKNGERKEEPFLFTRRNYTEKVNLLKKTNNTIMKEFMLILREDFAEAEKMSDEQMQTIVQDHMKWVEELTAKGRFKGGDGLNYDGKTIKGKNAVVTDGPFLEAKEGIGGYYLIMAENLDAATEIAKQCPTIRHGGSVEVRAIMEY